MGIRHYDDLVFWPHFSKYPKCHICLAPDVVEKDDKVSNETLLFPNDKVQDHMRRILKENGAEPTSIGTGDKKIATYIAPSDMVFPSLPKCLRTITRIGRRKRPPDRPSKNSKGHPSYAQTTQMTGRIAT